MIPKDFQKELDSCSPEFAAMVRRLCELSKTLLMENVCLRAIAKRTQYLETALLHALSEWSHYYALNLEQYCHRENADRLRDFEKNFRREWKTRKEILMKSRKVETAKR